MRLLSLLLFLLLLAPQVYADSPRILFDQSHRQAFLIEKNGPLQLQGLATIFVNKAGRLKVIPTG